MIVDPITSNLYISSLTSVYNFVEQCLYYVVFLAFPQTFMATQRHAHFGPCQSSGVLFAFTFLLFSDRNDHIIINPFNSFNITVDGITAIILVIEHHSCNIP
jgi:hypothetical protein